MNQLSIRLAAPLMGLMVVAVACAPTVAAPTLGEQTTPQASKTLTIALQIEPKGLGTLDCSCERPNTEVSTILHNYLRIEDGNDVYQPQLALELPSLEKGTWQVNANGTMSTTWRIRPNVRWHDGAPFTVHDLIFSFTVHKDPSLPVAGGAGLRLIQGATAPDPHTLVVQWSSIHVDGDSSQGFDPIPAHLLEAAYQDDPAQVLSSPLFTTDFVGLGPFRLITWEPGSHLELARFEDYYLGRAPLDKILVRFLSDPNTMVASILAGAVDIVLPPGVDLESALGVKERWVGTPHRVAFPPTNFLVVVDVQHRPEYARPASGLTDPRVRQALYSAIDRSSLIDVITQGVAPAADSWIRPIDPLRPQVEGSIPQFPFNLNRARQLLSDAGWVRESGGALAHSQSTQRFETEIRARDSGVERESVIIADGWKGLGVESSLLNVPAALRSDREFQSTRTGVLIWAPMATSWTQDRLHSREIASAANRWAGSNWGGYRNPEADDLLDRLGSTIDPRQRVVLHRLILERVLADVPMMPLYWQVRPAMALGGVRASLTGSRLSWDVFSWDKD